MSNPAEDKIRLLMEETGCDRGEAELALTSAGYNLERAIRTIPTLLRHIVVLKAKFQVLSAHLYGLFLVIVDTKRKRLFRARAVTSYNPSIFEVSIGGDWYDFERELYSYRLLEGAHPSLTKDLELLLDDLWAGHPDDFLALLQSGNTDSLHRQLTEFFERKLQWTGLRLELSREELNLAQFQQLKKESMEPSASEPPRLKGMEESFRLPLSVEVELESDLRGIPAGEISLGDTVFSIISDERDIAKYLARLLGSGSGEACLALPTPVEALERVSDGVKLSTRLTTGIIGSATVPLSKRLRVQRHSDESWWKRLIFWSRQ